MAGVGLRNKIKAFNAEDAEDAEEGKSKGKGKSLDTKDTKEI